MHLRLGDDDLARVGVLSVFDGMVQQTGDPDHLTHFLYPVGDVAGIAQELLTPEKLQNQPRKQIRDRKRYFIMLAL